VNADTAVLSNKSAGFAISAAVTILFNTILACAKDASPALLKFMNHLAWHNWITQGIADLILFFALGLLLSRPNASQSAKQPAAFLTASVIIAGLGLFVWYLLF
jgi:uncharacterized membrane protein SirB2